MKNLSVVVVLLIAYVICNIGCNERKNTQTLEELIKKNDTTEIIRILIDSGFHRKEVIGWDKLLVNNPFKDTPILSMSSEFAGHYPTGLRLKFLTSMQVDSLASIYNIDTINFWTVLCVNTFQKLNDSFYHANLVNMSIFPLYDSKGRALYHDIFTGLYKKKNVKYVVNSKYCRGLSMDFFKEGNKFETITNQFIEQ
jgi:hypothetical protein